MRPFVAVLSLSLSLSLSLGCVAEIHEGEQPLGVFSGPTGSFEAHYEEAHDQYLVGGDMLFAQNSLSLGATTVPGAGLWPGGTIPYLNSANSANFEQAVQVWNSYSADSGIRLVPRTDEFSYLVVMDDGASCSSAVGKTQGAQEIWVSSNCSLGDAVHEIGHAIGFVHEHMRGDRDQFIDIHWDNIAGGAGGYIASTQLASVPQFGTLFDYDVDSIMHYPNMPGGGNGAPFWVLDASQPWFTVRANPGHRPPYDRPSFADVVSIRRLYINAPQEEECPNPLLCNPPGSGSGGTGGGAGDGSAPEEVFACDNGETAPLTAPCDGNKDCSDGSDEQACK